MAVGRSGGPRGVSVKRIVCGLLCGIAAYPVFAVAGYFLVLLLSSNSHDREVEAAMTAAFVFGPLGLVTGLVVGAVWVGRPR